MSSNAHPPPTTPTSSRHQRRNLRTATAIVPSTGERIRRTITLPALGQNGNANGPNAAPPSQGSSPLLDTGQTRWGTINNAIAKTQQALIASVDFIRSRNGKLVFKCSIAYLLASCGTFVPFLSNWLGQHQDGKHMVATCTVYFHAARSLGSMLEATTFAFIAFLYAAFLSLSSMGVSIFFASKDMLVTGHIVVLLFFVGGGLGYVAWTKQRLGNPLVNVACSLTSLASITIFVKEGSIQAAKFSEDKVVQVLKMVILGVAFALLANILIFPERAHDKLNKDLSKSTDHLGDLLNAITRAFLNGSEAEMQSKLFSDTAKAHKASIKSLKTDLAESKWEHLMAGHEKHHKIEAELVKCLQKLSQSIGGLRSAALMQFDLIRATQMKETKMTPRQQLSRQSSFLMSSSVTSEPEETTGLGLQAINEESEDNPPTPSVQTPTALESPSLSQSPSFTQMNGRATFTPAEMFTMFISQLGPSMKSLVHTLKLILDELPFDSAMSDKIVINENFHDSLHEAVDLFKTARKDALASLYRNKEMYRTHSLERLADYEEIAASCGHFSFALVDIAEEIGNYLELLEDLKVEQDTMGSKGSYDWLKFWHRDGRISVTKNPDDRLLEDRHEAAEDGPNETLPPALRRQDTTLGGPTKASTSPIPSDERPDWSYRLWRITQFFHRDDIRFTFKVGIGAALLAAPAFIASTRPTFTHFRLEWSLVSYMVVCSMTIGAVNTSGIERFIGTFIGAIAAVAGWILSDARAIPLALFGWVFSLVCFYIIVVMKRGPMGRFIFLTYNLSALYAYSLSVRDGDDDEDEGGVNPHIWEIVLHRVIAVTVGCLWAILVTRVIWPISARKKLKEGICLLWLRMGLIWKRDPLSLVLSAGTSQSKMMDIREEADLQAFLTGLDGLRASAKSEFELRGPFPEESMRIVLERTQRMLDNFHGVNVVITKNLKATPGEMEVLRYTANERAALSARISHLFSVLASSVKMEYPLNDVLPNIEHSRDRLLARVFEYRRREEGVSDVDFELIYAYVLATGQLAKDISAIIKELEFLYGTLNEDNFRLE